MTLADALPSGRLPALLTSAVHRFLRIDQLENLYKSAASGPSAFCAELLQRLEVDVRVSAFDLARVPRAGATIVVCNHPFGMLDGAILGDMLTRIRPDVRIVANRLLGTFPALVPMCILVDPFGGSGRCRENSSALKACLRHLRSGGLVVIFPAGEVSHFDFRAGSVRDPEWTSIVARLIRISGARTIPMFLHGCNGLPFQILGMLHPRLRTAALPAELLNKRGRVVEVRIGAPIEPSVPASMGDEPATRYLRLRSELLGRRSDTPSRPVRPARSLAPAVHRQLLTREIATLPASCLMQGSSELMSTTSIFFSGTRAGRRSRARTGWATCRVYFQHSVKRDCTPVPSFTLHRAF